MRQRKNMALMLDELMEFNSFLNAFKSVERLIWFRGVDGRERNGEHTFQVAMAAWFVIQRFGLALSVERAMFYALVHDLVETYANDTPAFVKGEDGRAVTPDRAGKVQREQDALRRIRAEWDSRFPALLYYLDAYGEQVDEESRLVYALDKLIAEINVYQDDGRTNKTLGLDIETLDLYKRPRIARHPFILELYEEHFKRLLRDKDALFARNDKEAVS